MGSARASDVEMYKGYPVLTIYTGRVIDGEDEFIRMGYAKAVAVCDQIDVIMRFRDQVALTRGEKHAGPSMGKWEVPQEIVKDF